MSWSKIKIDADGEKLNAFINHDSTEICINNIVELGETVKVDKKEYKVLSSSVDIVSDMLTIKVLAKASQPKEKKSDGKSTQG
tara:strand:- start:786 stop:1034 length:249 start_codon:yes stop_codon:yes gene_type:complete